MYEKDFLRGYELRNWDLTPRIYKILGVSALINVLALFVFAQGNLLTRKGCDSPFVSTVCQVLDTVYVSKIIYGLETVYDDESDYVAANLDDAEITFIDVSNETPPLSYPEGYFPLANPEQYTIDEEGNIVPKDQVEIVSQPDFNPITPAPVIPKPPAVINRNPPNLARTKPIYPRQNKNPVTGGDLPSSPLGKDPTADETTAGKSQDPTAKPAGDDRTTAENKSGQTDQTDPATKSDKPAQVDPKGTNSSEKVAAVQIKRKALNDLGDKVNKVLAENKDFSMETNFLVRARGRLKKDGRLDEDTFKYLEAKSTDQRMIRIVEESIKAIDAAGYLQYLEKLSGKDLELMLQQDDENITAVVESELESKQRAGTLKSGFDLLIFMTKKEKQGDNASIGDKDDLQLLNNATVEANGKKIIIKFVIPKPIAQDMIRRNLLEQKKQAEKEGKTSASQNAAESAETGR